MNREGNQVTTPGVFQSAPVAVNAGKMTVLSWAVAPIPHFFLLTCL
jgi:hypothetical protein